jgi:hypothetical protein
MLGLRLGVSPQVVITTTPKPVKLIRELIANPETVLTRGSTYDNRANLSPGFYAQIIRRYDGRQIQPAPGVGRAEGRARAARATMPRHCIYVSNMAFPITGHRGRYVALFGQCGNACSKGPGQELKVRFTSMLY